MIRNVVGIMLLFLLPSLVWLGYALLTRPGRPAREVLSEAPLVWLGTAGIALAFATLIYYGSTTNQGGPDQIYTPARIKDGQIEPGHFK
jgi:hypothetical protein